MWIKLLRIDEMFDARSQFIHVQVNQLGLTVFLHSKDNTHVHFVYVHVPHLMSTSSIVRFSKSIKGKKLHLIILKVTKPDG